MDVRQQGSLDLIEESQVSIATEIFAINRLFMKLPKNAERCLVSITCLSEGANFLIHGFSADISLSYHGVKAMLLRPSHFALLACLPTGDSSEVNLI